MTQYFNYKQARILKLATRKSELQSSFNVQIFSSIRAKQLIFKIYFVPRTQSLSTGFPIGLQNSNCYRSIFLIPLCVTFVFFCENTRWQSEAIFLDNVIVKMWIISQININTDAGLHVIELVGSHMYTITLCVCVCVCLCAQVDLLLSTRQCRLLLSKYGLSLSLLGN